MSFFRVEIHVEAECFSAFFFSEIANLSPSIFSFEKICVLLSPEKDCFVCVFSVFFLSSEKGSFILSVFCCVCEKPVDSNIL